MSFAACLRSVMFDSHLSAFFWGASVCWFWSQSVCLTVRFCALLVLVAVRQTLRRVEDYWEGYKLFCYSYYSHSVAHEEEFRRCKLGAFF